MSARVRLPAFFADRIGGVSTIEISATTVQDALHVISNRYHELAPLVFTANGTVNPMMIVFLNDTQLSIDQLQIPIKSGDEIQIVPAIEGG